MATKKSEKLKTKQIKEEIRKEKQEKLEKKVEEPKNIQENKIQNQIVKRKEKSFKKKRLKKEKIKEILRIPYWEKIWYKYIIDLMAIISFAITIVGLVFSIYSLEIAKLVRNDTEELTKMSEKDLYYTIRLYPTQDTISYEEHENYIFLPLELVVDDFTIKKDDFLDVNYNASFTHIKYFMVYDYNQEEKNYHYVVTKMDDKTQAKMRLEDQYRVSLTKMNYSLTPNREFAYVLIYTESVNRQNLDLVFFRYQEDKTSLQLETKTNENGNVEVEHKRIDKDIYLCRKYYTDLWSNGESEKQDVDFMFDVYQDLLEKLKEQL